MFDFERGEEEQTGIYYHISYSQHAIPSCVLSIFSNIASFGLRRSSFAVRDSHFAIRLFKFQPPELSTI
jgi:hypothetical protein